MSEQTIFLAALDIADPTERNAYIESACAGNTVLRQQILALLAAHERSGAFLDVPAVAPINAGVSQPDDCTIEAPRGDGNPSALHFLQPSTKPNSLGRLGHYEVLEVLGQGGFGIVVKAFDDVLHRVVAIKIMSEQMAATSPPRQRFLREARSAAAVRHDNVVAIHDIQEQPIPYLVMEYIPGQTLQEKLDETGPLKVAEVLRFGQQIANGLAAAHALGLVHRDIKPSNILLERGVEQRVKITDFGLARAADDASLTQSGVIAGTPMYMSPEQAAGETIDHRADLFSLGSVLYVMVSGRPPFRASTTMGVLKRVAEDTPRPIREIIPEVPEWLVAIISKLHAKKPEERYQTAKEVADLLARCQSDPQPWVDAQPLTNRTQLTPSARSSEQVQSEVGHFAIDAEQEVRRQREELALAVNDHDLEAIKRIIHPSYIGKTKSGYTSSYQEIISLMARVTAADSDFQEVVQIEHLIVDGDTARLTVRRSFSIKLRWLTRRGTTRTVETWRKLDGRWQLVEEQELERVSGTVGPTDRAKRSVKRAGIVAACALAILTIAASIYFWPPGLFQAVPVTKLAIHQDTPPLAVAPFDAAQAKEHQEAWAKHLGVEVDTTNSIGMKLRLIPPGQFLMGSPDDEPGREAHEGPQHEVVITRPFCMGAHDVTVGQFKAFVKAKGYKTEAEKSQQALRVVDGGFKSDPQINWQHLDFEQGDDHPVVCVSWFDAKAFCDWLSEKEGKKYMLPTEAQREYACRAGSTTKFFFGDDDRELGEYAWYNANSKGKTHPVGQKKPNAWGLYDLDGNVTEWIADWYAADYYQNSPKEDPPGPSVSPIGARVFRGGNWWLDASNSRAARRVGNAFWLPWKCATGIGFRVVQVGDLKMSPVVVAPFVVLAGKGQPERSFATLKDAVDKATSGDTIEIRGNGPFQTAPMVLDKALTLRAGAGYRPVLVHTRDGWLLNATATLVLEGLEFHSFGNKRKPSEGQFALLSAYATPFRMAHCRIVVVSEDLNAISTFKSPMVEVKHSEVFDSGCAVDCRLVDRARFVIQNCCMGRASALEVYENSKPARDAEVELTDNTIVSDQKIWVHRFWQDPVSFGKEDFRSVRFNAVGNVFHSQRRFGVVQNWDDERPFRSDALADWYHAHVTWEARENLFAVKDEFLAFTPHDEDKAQEGASKKTSKDWQAFWKVEKAPGMAGNPRFAGGDLLERLQKEPLSLTAADFRLEKGSPGQGVGPEGKDLGADVDKVGPGAAYEKWRKTPEYQEWRKKTEELMSRP